MKKISALLRGITLKNNGDFYCLSCLYSVRTKNKLESHKKVSENKDFSGVIIPSKDSKIWEFNQYQKPDKAPFIIYADLQFFDLEDGYKNNPEKSFTTKVGKRIPCCYSISKYGHLMV